MYGVLAEQGMEAVIRHVAFETLAGSWPIVVDFAVIFIISFLQEDAAFVVRMDHENFSLFQCVFLSLFKPFLPNLRKADIIADMPT